MIKDRIFLLAIPILLIWATGCQKPQGSHDKTNVSQTSSATSFHDKSRQILKNFVDKHGTVNYRALKIEKLQLTDLLEQLAQLSPDEYSSWSQQDKLAFWINNYNLQMLKIIIDNYPIKSSRVHRLFWPPDSIRHISGIRDKYKFVVMDEVFTIAEIEERVFRKEFNEPRVFFGISQATLSGPPLRNEPYYGYKLTEQLDDQVKKFLSSNHAFKIDRIKQRVYLSALLQPTWYGNAFTNRYTTDKKFKDQDKQTRAILNFVSSYIPNREASFLEVGNYSVKYLEYDWRLNDTN